MAAPVHSQTSQARVTKRRGDRAMTRRYRTMLEGLKHGGARVESGVDGHADVAACVRDRRPTMLRTCRRKSTALVAAFTLFALTAAPANIAAAPPVRPSGASLPVVGTVLGGGTF